MKPTTTYYDLLEVNPIADLAEISTAYLRLSRELTAGNSPLAAPEAEFRLKLIKHAYEVLSNPSRRSDYDDGLALRGAAPAGADRPLQIEVAMESSKWSPIRRLLTIIASLMIAGMAIQVVTMFMAYKRTSAIVSSDPASSASEKVYLQDFFQTYGIRAASKAEAETLLAEIKRKERAEREANQKQRIQEQQEREQRRFEEESRRLGAEVSANLRRVEQEEQRAREDEIRRKEETERMAKEQELARKQLEIDRFRQRGVSPVD